MAVLLTGAAGFIGYHVGEALLARGNEVVGIDDLNAYYDPRLKQARLARLQRQPGFRFQRLDIADRAGLSRAVEGVAASITGVVHLAAQAGVRHSLSAPFDYVRSNLDGHMAMLELCRHELPALAHLVYASSSSVYGGNTKTPFSVEDRVDHPVSLYAATKRADELFSHAYSHLYRLPQTGLRFFTVYGPWGRPDMAPILFAEAIAAGRPITLFNFGEMQRDFTYIDDIVDGVLAALDRPPQVDGEVPHRIYNLGNHQPIELRRFVALLEGALGIEADKRYGELQPGDVITTFADIEASRRDLGFAPRVPIEDGIGRFVAWFRSWRAGEA